MDRIKRVHVPVDRQVTDPTGRVPAVVTVTWPLPGGVFPLLFG